MMNNVQLIGRLTRTPELNKTQTGKSVINVTVACDHGFGDKKKTEFVNCQAWNGQAEFIANYLKQGSLVAVEGRVQSRSYEDGNGRKVYVQEVLVQTVKSLSTRAENEQAQGQEQSFSSNRATSEVPSYASEEPIIDITSDDLPL